MVKIEMIESTEDGKLEVINQLKTILNTEISEGIRSPLTAIRGFAELLLISNNLNPDMIEGLQIIMRNELRLEQQIVEIEKKILRVLEDIKK